MFKACKSGNGLGEKARTIYIAILLHTCVHCTYICMGVSGPSLLTESTNSMIACIGIGNWNGTLDDTYLILKL